MPNYQELPEQNVLYKSIVEIFRQIALSHKLVNGFFVGGAGSGVSFSGIAERNAEERKYPLLHLDIIGKTVTKTNSVTGFNQSLWNINLYCFDKVLNNESNWVQAQNDCVYILDTIIAHLDEFVLFQQLNIAVEERITELPYVHQDDADVSGWGINIRLRVPQDFNICNSPIVPYDFTIPNNQGITEYRLIGPQGYQGSRGDTGFQGAEGLQGFQGAEGLQGSEGSQGLEGPQGLVGLQGAEGLQGLQGLEGFQGNQGYHGLEGLQGLEGNQGNQGRQGIQGFQGNQGFIGLQGNQGNQGSQGNQGWQGPIGNQGLGFQGLQGLQGATGQAGSGAPGNNDVGVMYLKNNTTPTVIPTINERVVVAGTMSTGVLFNFIKDPLTNSLKYIGSGGRFHIIANFNFSGGNRDIYGFYIGRNTNDATPLDPNADRISDSEIYVNSNQAQDQPAAGTIQTILDLNTNDRVFFIVQNRDTTADLTVEFLKYTVTSLTAERGATGLQGNQGNQGLQGITGFQGNQGFQGRQGLQGLQGNQGLQGRQGLAGINGTNGNQGPEGPRIPRMISSFWERGKDLPQTPVAGGFTNDGSDFGTITQFYINIKDLDGINRTQLFDELESLILDNNLYLDVSCLGDFNKSAIYKIDSTDESGLLSNYINYIILNVSYYVGVDSSLSIAQGEQYQFTFEMGGGSGSGGGTGPQGLQGNQGSQGFQGRQGFQGFQGSIGFQGNQGNQGLQGLQGNQGLQGFQGNQGRQGIQGFQGFQGDNGPLIPRMISSFWQYTTNNTPTSGKFTSDDLTFDNITGIRINIEDIYLLDRRELFNILSSTTTLPFIDLTSIQDFSKSSVYYINSIDFSNVGSGYVDLSVAWAGSVDGSFTASSGEIYQITFEVKGKNPKFQNITIATASWAFDSGEGLWFVDISNSFLISQEQSVIFTPYNSTIMEVINAQILPEVRIDDGAQTFRLFAINEPTGDIEGEYIVINAI